MVSASNLLHHILHRPLPTPPSLSPPSSSSFLKPLRLFSTVSSKNPSKRFTNTIAFSSHFNHSNASTASKTKTLFNSRSLSLFIHTDSLSQPIKASLALEKEVELEEEEEEEEEEKKNEKEEEEEEEEEEKEKEAKLEKEDLHSLRVRTNGMELPSLSVKEKKELSSYAHSLGTKLKSQLVGKSGVNSNVATSFIETLEANELLKIKVHRTCPGELEEVVKQLEELTGSVVVGKIGRTVILYRPSLTKLKAEEKKRQFQKIFEKRKLRPRPTFQAKGAGLRPRFSGRGRRGSSRFSSSTAS